MKAVIQRVSKAKVCIRKLLKAEIGNGLLVLIGIEEADTKEDIDWLCLKLSNLRIFDDASGVMNLSVRDINGEVLAVSQFTTGEFGADMQIELLNDGPVTICIDTKNKE